MSESSVPESQGKSRAWGSIIVLAGIVVVGAMTTAVWLPRLQSLFVAEANPPADDHGSEADHAGHDDSSHATENCLEISPQARAGIGLKLGRVKTTTFQRTITLPGMVVERRGRSKTEITAPFTGVVTRIHATEGEAVSPGKPLFELRLTYEDLVQSQTDLLRTAEELDVIKREVERLEIAGRDGAIAGKSILERKYEQQKQEAAQRAQVQSLLLHGLSQEQVNSILTTRRLVSTLTVAVPTEDDAGTKLPESTVFQVQELRVERGQQVESGAALAVITDHTELLIEGEAFEQDAPLISRAAELNYPLSTLRDDKAGLTTAIEGLRIKYLANRVDSTSRAIHFYVALPNELVRDGDAGEGRRFVEWKYKPGQRMSLRVPVEQWPDRIVLPAEAVAQDGVESYVFRANGDHFDRQTVQVAYRDPQYVVLADDGSVFPGDSLAMNGAQQMQLALKNKSGAPLDPHAGHSH